ncbi:MAG: Hsp70 family protein [Aristaeellaceae bacterium]
MPYYYGIDLGTTNTVISCLKMVRKENILTLGTGNLDKLEVVPIVYEYADWNDTLKCFEPSPELGAAKPRSLPSVVYEHVYQGRSTFLTGQPAITMYQRDNSAYPERYYENTKSLMDQDVTYIGLTAADIAYHLLKTCFHSIMEYMKAHTVLSRRPAAIGISYPAARNQRNYLANLRQAANRAAREAGLLSTDAAIDFFCTTQEPYAAFTGLLVDECMRYNKFKVPMQVLQTDSSRCVNLMVVDIGGGTTDIAVQPIQHVNSMMAHLPVYPEVCVAHDSRSAVNLNGDFGGADFDGMLARKIARRLYQTAGMGEVDFETISAHAWNRALECARKVKHYFADQPDAHEFRENIYSFFSRQDIMRVLVLTVPNAEYNDWIRPYIEGELGRLRLDSDYKRMPDGTLYSFRNLMDTTRLQANCKSWDDIDYIYLTGGMSKIPQIRRMIQEMINDSSCRLIIADERYMGNKEEECPRFLDIAQGVAVYACLNDDTVIQGEGRKYRDYTAAPHSSVALLADVGEGLPVVLIDHSQALPVENEEKPDAFVSVDVAGISVQLYTGYSPYDPKLKKLTNCFVSLSEHPALGGTGIALRYSIDQNMRTTLAVRYRDAQNKERIVNMREINLDATNLPMA